VAIVAWVRAVAVIAVSTLRQRLAAAVEALTLPAPWRESRWNADDFPADPGTYAHLAFAVSAPITRYTSIMESYRHKRGADGALVDSEFAVRWTFRLRADRQVADFDAALDAEAVLIKAISGASLVDAHIGQTQARRRVVGDGTWMLGELAVIATHRLPLQ
jgi:hypothetical protein